MGIQSNKVDHKSLEQIRCEELSYELKILVQEVKALKEAQKRLEKIISIENPIRDEITIKEQKKHQKQVQEMFDQQQRYTEELLRLKKEKDKLQKTREKEDKKKSKVDKISRMGESVTPFPKNKSSRMKTHEQYEEQVRALVGDEYTVIGRYEGATHKIRFKHNVCGLEYEVIPSGFTSKGNRCPECTKSLKGKGRKGHNTFLEEVYQAVRDEYTVLEKYKSSKSKVLMRHNLCGHEWKVSPHLFLSKTRCPKCAENKKKKEFGRTHDQYVKEINRIHKGAYTILGEYINGNTKILALHNECGYQWEVRAQSLLGYTRCPKCYGVLRKTQEEFEDQVKDVSSNEYLVIGEYVNNRTDIEILHQVCGHIFEVTPNAFLQGKRCPICKYKDKE